MKEALYGAAMDNPMAVVPKMDDPVPEKIHECPCCGAVWEKWDERGPWQCDSGLVHRTHADPIADECCPLCATESAGKDVIIDYCERRGIQAQVMGYIMTANGEGIIEDGFTPLLWRMSKEVLPDTEFWMQALDYIGEYHRSDFFEHRKELGV